ncbi:MAG: sigma-70 family RNA polymerase sigma factor [Candidatus Marinimicrobia bacterium]|nr:sigma-70 family RNA polymerase sigma factor [Candidatus Neomarinimicrobiota bacterium]
MNEEQLIDKAKKGDKAAQAKLVVKYESRVYNLALRMMRDTHDAEDVMQETFLIALRKLDSFEGRSQLFTWLYRITMNISLQKLRDNKKYDTSVSLSDPDFESMHGKSMSEWPSYTKNMLSDQDFRHLLDSAIKSLPPIYRSVFILRDIEGLSTEETKKLLELTDSNVKVRLMRARFFLREKLADYFTEGGKV